jgi:cysteine desulfurase
MIYLDYHSTTPVDPRVVKTMEPFFSDCFGNPSAAHSMGEDAKEAVEKAREQIASLINAEPEEIYFTNSATEANNIVLKGIWLKDVKGYRSYSALSFVTSKIEHSSVLKCVQSLGGGRVGYHARCGTTYVEVFPNGTLNLDHLESILGKLNWPVVSLMAANNEIGTINDIETIGNICKNRKVFYHCDAVQALGKIPIDVKKLNINALTVSGHKICGPKGIGALYLKSGRNIEPLIDGGYQNIFSSGTQNVPAIVGFGKACEILQQESEEENKRVEALKTKLFTLLLRDILDIEVNGTLQNRLPNNLNISIPGVPSEALIKGMDDIMVSGGAACESGNFEPSHVLQAIKAPRPDCSIRFGLGRWTTEEEIDYAANRIIEIVKSIRS